MILLEVLQGALEISVFALDFHIKKISMTEIRILISENHTRIRYLVHTNIILTPLQSSNGKQTMSILLYTSPNITWLNEESEIDQVISVPVVSIIIPLSLLAVYN